MLRCPADNFIPHAISLSNLSRSPASGALRRKPGRCWSMVVDTSTTPGSATAAATRRSWATARVPRAGDAPGGALGVLVADPPRHPETALADTEHRDPRGVDTGPGSQVVD